MADRDERKRELIRDLDRARGELSTHSRGARAEFDLNSKIRASFSENRFTWIGGAALIGLVVAKLRPRTKKVPISHKLEKQLSNAGMAGLGLTALKLVLDLTKPLLIAWATKRMGEFAGRSTQRSDRWGYKSSRTV